MTAELLKLYDAGYGLLLLQTFEEGRALQLAQELSGQLRVPLSTWSLAQQRDPSPSGTPESLVDLLRGLRRERSSGLFVLLGLDPRALSPLERRLLREVIAEGPLFKQYLLAIGPVAEVPDELAREATSLVLPPPSAEELARVFQECCEALGVRSSAEEAKATVVAALGLGLEEARRAFRLALRQKGNATGTVLAEKRRLLRRSAALDCLETEGAEAAGLSAVGGMDELKHWLQERQRSLLPEARAFGLPPPRGLLLLGVQGCGKSLCAKAVASQWQLPLARLDLAGVFGSEASPEATLRQAIAAAEAMAPAVLWVDEIEKGFGGAELSRDPALFRLFGWFIVWLAERQSQLFVVATANEVEGLPPELLRKGRFDETFFVDLPDARSRAEILAIHLRRRGRDPGHFPLPALAQRTEHFSGSELEQLVIAALHRAFAEGRELTTPDLERVAHEAVPLYRTYEERIKALRAWAAQRARSAATNVKLVDLFQQGK